ncbi:MAG: hypothetical protein U9R74_19985 [Pseudomonadota bacterium]|nr:hypothetical protein [Pseudomonadota bacterium]
MGRNRARNCANTDETLSTRHYGDGGSEVRAGRDAEIVPPVRLSGLDLL